MDARQRIGCMLEHLGIARAGDMRRVAELSGGVSSDVFVVETDDLTLCVKFAIEQLRVASEWTAPVGRSAAEYEWLAFVGSHFIGWVPETLGYDPERHGMAMAYLPPKTFRVWKTDLLAGRVDNRVAAALGGRLAMIHARSAETPELYDTFANQADFDALRIDPYLRFTAFRHPEFAERLNALADALAVERIALVHGDVSPKNILCGPDGPVFIDAECATFGDPAFDVAFCLNHLLIKALVLQEYAADLTDAASALWNAYVEHVGWEPAAALESRVAALLPALMLARVDGKSPLEYLTPLTAGRVRARACELLAAPPDRVGAIFEPAPASMS